MIKTAGIPDEEQQANAQTILDVVGFMEDSEAEDLKFIHFTASPIPHTEETAFRLIHNCDSTLQQSASGSISSPSSSALVSKLPSIDDKISSNGNNVGERNIEIIRRLSKNDLLKETTNPPPITPRRKPASINVTSSMVIPKKPIPGPKPKIDRPPVPARPPHTLTEKSTELKPDAPKPPKPYIGSKEPLPVVLSLSNTKSKPELVNNIPTSDQGPPVQRRTNKKSMNVEDVIRSLVDLCNPADPTRIYKNLIKIGQGCIDI